MKTTNCPSAVGDLLQHRLEPLLELAAELRAGDERAEVERDEPLVAQALGHVAVHDALREPFGDRRLADAGLADEHGIVLRAAREHLHHAADLLVAADDRIELALARRLGEVARVALQRLVLVLRRLVGDAMRAAHRPAAPRAARARVAPAAPSRIVRLSVPFASESASSRCSVETYSSPRSFASSSARSKTWFSSRDSDRLGVALLRIARRLALDLLPTAA